MFDFQITNSMVARLEKIHAVWGVIENAQIVPHWEQKLIKIARLRSGVFSTRIEGNQINLEEAELFLKGKPIKARERDKQELKNYLSVLDYIEKEEAKKHVTEEHIFKIHNLTTRKFLSRGLKNKYRQQQNAIYKKDGSIVYMPPAHQDVAKLMKSLLTFMNLQVEISPLIRAAILHHWFVIIHPFVDGNGRTARALTQLFLYQNGFNTKKYFSLEEYYDQDLENYYQALNIGGNFYTAMEKGIKSTKFIEYFLGGVLAELDGLKQKIASIKEEELFENTLIEAKISNRQIHLMLFIKEKRRVKSSDFLKKFRLSLPTIKRELKSLTEKGLIKAEGKGKSTYYEPNMSRI
jgi:Fic family protein